MIIAGSARVVAAMMWLMNDGTMCTKMMRICAAADQPGRHDEVLLAQRQEAAAHHARQLRPAEQRNDDRDGEVDLQDRPVARQRRGQAHPERNRRDRAEDLDDALDEGVDQRRRRSPTCRPARRREPGSCDTPDQPDRQRDARARTSAATTCRAPARPCPGERSSRPHLVPGSTPIRWRVIGIKPENLYAKPWAKKRTGIFWLGSALIDALERLAGRARP